jgi:hypothetical protein
MDKIDTDVRQCVVAVQQENVNKLLMILGNKFHNVVSACYKKKKLINCKTRHSVK